MRQGINGYELNEYMINDSCVIYDIFLTSGFPVRRQLHNILTLMELIFTTLNCKEHWATEGEAWPVIINLFNEAVFATKKVAIR